MTERDGAFLLKRHGFVFVNALACNFANFEQQSLVARFTE
jgi:hypothetical protein